MTILQRIDEAIGQAMRGDRHRLRQRLRELAQAGEAFDAGRAARLLEEAKRSIALCDARRQSVPKLRYDDDLPIFAHRDEITAAVASHPVVIVCGETGSGKSTQLPKMCLEMGRGITGLIGHTQPRRIAASSIATRVAEELGVPLGKQVGFKTRFADRTSAETLVKLMTDGILLAESLQDRFLERYDTIIVDEAHERSLNIDFLLGYIKRLLARRKDLKLIITSATIDAARFSRHFAINETPAPVVEVSGRTYPVELRYRPIDADEDTGEVDVQRAVADAVAELSEIDRGDILIFMPTERDIHETAKTLRGTLLKQGGFAAETEILPLYARLSDREHARVFQPHQQRRIIIATNVAESSLTVPGVRYVIDPGTARISRYSARSRTQRLPIEPIARASADQRAGRCGRIAPGVCIRLYSEADYRARDQYTPPEIQRTNLAAVILQALALRLGDLGEYPFLDPPRGETIRDGYNTLFELGAVDDSRQLTRLGRRLAGLPVDPRIGRMILAAEEENCLADVLIIAGVLELQDPRERPQDKRELADQKHAAFAHGDSDFLAYLKLWDFYHGLKSKLSRNQLRKACGQNFLSANRMNEWLEIHRQLLRLVTEAGLKVGKRRPWKELESGRAEEKGDRHLAATSSEGPASHKARAQSPFSTDAYGVIHRAILTGLLSNVALRGETYEFTAAGGRKCVLWPGSGLFARKPKWLVAAEVIETTQRYLRCCARIDPAWIEPLADHLVRRSLSDPHWDRATGSTKAYEKVSLFGLTVVPRRRIALGPIDPKRSRQLMLWHGLVHGEVEWKAPFLEHNARVRGEVAAWQVKLRRNDLYLGDEVCYDFYDAAIPADVYDIARVRQWTRELPPEDYKRLLMKPEDLVREPVSPTIAQEFPDEFCINRLRLPLEYAFAPGEPVDGVTVNVPVEILNQLDATQTAWAVPGLLEKKVVALIKSLPKSQRRNLVPAPDVAQRIVPQLQFGRGTLEEQLAQALSHLAGERITPVDFKQDRLPLELQLNIRAVDREGKQLAMDRDIDRLRRDLVTQTVAALAEAEPSPWHRDGLTRWDFGDLPETVETPRRGLMIRAFPALIDQGNAVGLRLTESPARAQLYTRRGLRRLFMLHARRTITKQVEWLPDLDRWLVYATLIPKCDLKAQLVELLADRGLVGEPPWPRHEAEFHVHLRTAAERIGVAVQDVVPVVGPLLAAHHHARLALDELVSQRSPLPHVLSARPAEKTSERGAGGEGSSRLMDVPSANRFAAAVTDIRGQLDRLVSSSFLANTPWMWLKQFGRYFQGVDLRIERLRGGEVARDRQLMDEVLPWESLWQERFQQRGPLAEVDTELTLFRWMIEEFRVSLFAQRLGTLLPVSTKRLERQWAKVEEEAAAG